MAAKTLVPRYQTQKIVVARLSSRAHSRRVCSSPARHIVYMPCSPAVLAVRQCAGGWQRAAGIRTVYGANPKQRSPPRVTLNDLSSHHTINLHCCPSAPMPAARE